ncbi:S-layer homology domain-containing protein [Candidatus Dojkabacteria bacterium]|nr:S-layer homology domain-containing protein [Candidatus Dojkabacteria bacterium]
MNRFFNILSLLPFIFFTFISLSSAADNNCEGVFSDVSASYNLCENIEFLYKQGVLNYYQPFYPDHPVSRGEFAQMVRRAFLIPVSTQGVNFPDVFIQNPYFDDILAIKNAKIVSGTNMGSYNPDQYLTRAEATKILVNSINYKFPNTITAKNSGTSSFKDLYNNDILHSFVFQLLLYSDSNQYRILNGFSDGTFKPSNFITRAQASKIISNSMIPLNLQKVKCSSKYCTDIKLNGFPVFDFNLEYYLFDLINASRIKYNLEPFTYNPNIALISDVWSTSMSSNKILSHNLNLTASLKSSGIDFKYNGENVATRTISDTNNPQKYYEAVNIIHQSIMNQSPPNDQHRQNILSQSYPFDQIGLSVIISKDYIDSSRNRIWVVENFIQTK